MCGFSESPISICTKGRCVRVYHGFLCSISQTTNGLLQHILLICIAKEVFIDNKRSGFAPIKQNNTIFFKKTTVKDTTKVLAKKFSHILTNMFITAQQQNTNEVRELLKREVALPPPSLTIPTTGVVKFATKASVVESLVSFTEKHLYNYITMMLFLWTGA